MRGIIKKSYSFIINAVKAWDKRTNYAALRWLRKITNTNSKKFYDDLLARKGKQWRSFPYETLLEFLPTDKPFTLLDIGCALGDGCIFLKEKFPDSDFSGADWSSVGIATAKEKSKEINFFELNILKNSPPKNYDYISMLSTLEHFDHPYEVIEKCLKFVNKALFIYSPYTKSFDDPHLYGSGLHRFLFNEDTFAGYDSEVLKITQLVEATGYQYILYRINP
ncbi:MAG: class I SAM-dependent methyltransferase [Candidatus Omnitrophota bacterium]